MTQVPPGGIGSMEPESGGAGLPAPGAGTTGRADAVFGALADPNRRYLVEALAEREAATATELAAELPVTRQAVSKHLAALGEAGLVESDRVGRETRYRLAPAALGDALTWIERVGAQWDERLSALRRHLGG
jgi:DNA-binding transcriptional ArsR family regulator